MSTIDTTMETLKNQIEDIDREIDTLTEQLKELKKVRRKLASTVGALEKL